jgi:hypothetical protein
LIGAVLLDYKAQHLHTLSEQMSPVSIEDIPQIKKAKANDQRFRRHLYFNTLCRFLGVHVWALALCATLIWIFNGTETGLIMFLAYVGAYTGLLLYQYNKIFSGPHALMPLLAAVVLGFVLGNILMKVMPESFLYDKVIALAVSTWAAAIFSFRTAKLGLPETFDMRMWFLETLGQVQRRKRPMGSTESFNIQGVNSQLRLHLSSDEKYHAYFGAGADAEFSQSELHAFCDKLKAAPKEDRFRIVPTGHPGDEITAMLLSCTHENLTRLALQAFPSMPFLVQRIVLAWKDDLIKVFIVPMQTVAETNTRTDA